MSKTSDAFVAPAQLRLLCALVCGQDKIVFSGPLQSGRITLGTYRRD